MAEQETPASNEIELAYRDDVDERYANTYYVMGTHYGIRLAFGLSKVAPGGVHEYGRFHTAIHMDYKLAKQFLQTIQTTLADYESLYGPQDVRSR
jgi:hypothetical protein